MKVSIQKYDPSVDEQPYIVDFDVEWHEHMTVLEAITAINDDQAPVVFDYSCRGRDCGRCAMSLNGQPCLACVTLVDEAGENLIAPLPGFPVVKDLVVDKTKVTDRVAGIMQRQRAKAITCAEKLPNLYKTRESALVSLAEGEERHTAALTALAPMAYLIRHHLTALAETEQNDRWKEKIQQILSILFDEITLEEAQAIWRRENA